MKYKIRPNTAERGRGRPPKRSPRNPDRVPRRPRYSCLAAFLGPDRCRLLFFRGLTKVDEGLSSESKVRRYALKGIGQLNLKSSDTLATVSALALISGVVRSTGTYFVASGTVTIELQLHHRKVLGDFLAPAHPLARNLLLSLAIDSRQTPPSSLFVPSISRPRFGHWRLECFVPLLVRPTSRSISDRVTSRTVVCCFIVARRLRGH